MIRAALFTGVVSGFFIGIGIAAEESAAPAASPKPSAAPSKLRKLDMARVRENIRFHNDYALETAKNVLAIYDAANDASEKWYAQGRTAVELFIYWSIGSDFYGEGLLQTANNYAKAAYDKGCRDPLIRTICDVYTYQEKHSIKMEGATEQRENIESIFKSGYPTICKYDAAVAGVRNVAHFTLERNKRGWKEDMTPAIEFWKSYLDQALAELSSLIQAGAPEDFVFDCVVRLVDGMDRSPEMMEVLNSRLEPTLATAGASERLILLSKGRFLIDWAWTARGTGWAKTVTEEGWRLMGERLQLAHEILEGGAKKFPKDAHFPISLLSVELGLGMGKPYMESLFKRAVEIDPSNYTAYSRKMYYLQPRWHGSPEEVFEFGLECIKTGRWSDKIPLAFIHGVDLIADQNEGLYESEPLWKIVNDVLAEYLKRYPESTHYRTRYLEWAAKSKHWDVAREQNEILGPNWDRTVLGTKDYSNLIKSIPNP
jgi:hypothetical protein